MDLGLLLVRLVALGLAAHGAQKLFGWFGGYGLAGTGGYFASIGHRPGRLMAAAAGFSELAGGLLVVLGLGGPLAALLVIGVMIPAIATHWPKFFAQDGGLELALTYLALATVFAFTGYGAYSLDAALGLTGLTSPAFAWAAIAIGLLGGLGAVATRRAPAAQPNAG